ncbi:protein transport protein SEC23 [Leishmania donovani]|nr:Sec23/Sec24 trunk domain family protein [Leishmania donovani]CAJ1986707.1 protein transport protein SEC23 [Leishmania donovani]
MNQGYNTYYSQGTPQGGAYGSSANYYGGAAAAPAGGVGSGYGAQAQPQQPQAQQVGAYGVAQATSAGSWSNTYQGLGEYHSGVATAAPTSSPSQGYYGGGAATTTASSFQVGYDGYAQGATAAATNNGGVAAGVSNGSYAGVTAMNAYDPQSTQPAQQPYYPPQPPQGGYYGNANACQANSTPAAAAAPAPAVLNTTDDNGLRWTWSCYPTTSKAKTKENPSAATLAMPEMVIPMSCMYTPLHLIEPSHLVLGAAIDELCCANCGAFCSMHSQREMGKYWVCVSCKRRNSFQSNTAITEQHPALMYETVEFVLANPPTPVVAPPQPQPAPAFIFVVDTCIPSGEMASLRTSLLESLQYLPRNALVGLISFGATVSVWELGASSGVAISKCYLLRGNTANPPDSLQSMLQVSENHPVRGRLLAPLCDVEAALTSLIEELEEDGAAVPSSKRPLRATSTAVEAATYLMEALAPPQMTAQQQYVLYGKHVKAATAPGGNVKMGKILLFTGGPCTRGPGAVVSTDKADMMRFHRDIIEGDTPYYEAAFNFYNALEPRMIAANTCLDVFAQSLDQVGVMEMRRCIDNTGGTLIVEDETTDIMFLESLKRYWQRCDLRAGTERALAAAQEGMSSSGVDGSYSSEDHRAHCGFAVHMEVNTSVGTLLRGALGPCNVDVEANKRGPTRLTSPLEVGAGGTTRWCVSYLDKGMTLSFLFDTATASSQQSGAESAHEKRFIQFVTRYTTPRGEQRVRVTSVVQPVAPPTAPPDYYTKAAAFDQTCAATIVARMAVSILEKHPGKWDDAKRWLDTLLVRFVRRYSTFSPGQPNTLRLDPCLSLFPSFMYNLRRSEYFMVLNISPDETTFKRHWLLRESVDNCVLMIQPTLDSYDLASPFATPMQLDSSSLRHDNIVLMDAYFNVHIMWGSIIYQWIEAAYHENPEYANFAELLEAAERDAQMILSSRYPYPRFSRTDADGSEARHVKTRVNPATNYHNSGMQYGAGPNGAVEQADVIYTDDASIMTFMTSLKKAVVTSDGKEEA